MKIIDTHAHLDHLEDLEEALILADQQGVESIIAVSEDYQSSKKNLEISIKYKKPNIVVGMGMHPSEIKLDELDKCKELIYSNQRNIRAIGEIGLDFWYKWVRKDEEKKLQQKEAFRFFLDIALDLNLPVVIHSRGAWSECFEIAKEKGIQKAVFHWYSGPIDILEKILAEGYYISATPSLQYGLEAQKAIKYAPIEKILIETDTPVYYRNRETKEGFKSQPKDVYKTLEFYCNLRSMDQHMAVEIFNSNAKKFFNI